MPFNPVSAFCFGIHIAWLENISGSSWSLWNKIPLNFELEVLGQTYCVYACTYGVV